MKFYVSYFRLREKEDKNMKKKVPTAIEGFIVIVVLMTAASPVLGVGVQEKIIQEPWEEPGWQCGSSRGGYALDDEHDVSVEVPVDISFSITGGIGVAVVLTNTGVEDATDVPWLIHVEGGMIGLVKKTAEGQVNVSAASSISVNTGVFLGLGPIMITARVGAVEKTASGTQVIFFSIVEDTTW